LRFGFAATLAALALVCLSTAPRAAAQAPPAPAAASPNLRTDQQALAQLTAQAPGVSDDGRLAAMGAHTLAIEARAQSVVASDAAALARLDQALKRAGAGRKRLTASQRKARAPLLVQRAPIAAQLGQAQGVAAGASNLFSQIAERRREGFSARLLERSPSPVSPDFWTQLTGAAGADLQRLNAQAYAARITVENASGPKAGAALAGALVLIIALLWPARLWLLRLGRRKAANTHAPTGLARTAGALWTAAVDTGLPALAAGLLMETAQWSGVLSDKAKAVAGAGVVAVAWAAAILALGRALATDTSGRRLMDISDDAAGRIRFSLWTVALITGAGLLLGRINFVVGASVAATIAANCVLSLAYAGAAGLILVSFGRSRAPHGGGTEDQIHSPVWTLVSLSLSSAIIVTVGAVFCGYTTLAALVSNQIFWLSILAAMTYILLRFIDDLCTTLFGGHGWAARNLASLFNLHVSTIGQAGVLISAALQLIVLIGVVSLALTPFGQSGGLLLANLSQLGKAIHIGSATISPPAVAAGVATLVVGIAIAHMVQRWVVRRYLPVTGWDAGLRNSVATGVGYLGVGLAMIGAMAAMGLGFAQIALIASALSVGIGFGLQQIVQNFVCGVILLIERPVKVGDWVSVDGVEGDIRRIRVRATEIQTFDRSTVIVPNSDLVTKQVQNKTLGDPRGRIQLLMTIGKPTDAAKGVELIAAQAEAHPKILRDPPPRVFVDSLTADGRLVLNAYLYVASPRDAYSVRSEMFLAAIAAFTESGVSFQP
jgi:potassium-dependent mechanosensitive channel